MNVVCSQIQVYHPEPGLAEMDPEELWQQIQDVCKEAVAGMSLIHSMSYILYQTVYRECVGLAQSVACSPLAR